MQMVYKLSFYLAVGFSGLFLPKNVLVLGWCGVATYGIVAVSRSLTRATRLKNLKLKKVIRAELISNTSVWEVPFLYEDQVSQFGPICAYVNDCKVYRWFSTESDTFELESVHSDLILDRDSTSKKSHNLITDAIFITQAHDSRNSVRCFLGYGEYKKSVSVSTLGSTKVSRS